MQPRLVEAMGFDFDVVPEKYMLFIRNEDRPGMIGKLGSILGRRRQHGNMAVGRGELVPARRWPPPWTSLVPEESSTPS